MAETYDYSGLQFYGLTNTPLSHHLRREARLSDCGKEVVVTIDDTVRWSDGSRVSPKEYLLGIERVIQLNPMIRRLLMRSVRNITVDSAALRIQMNQPNYRMLEVLSLPNFSPLKGNDENLSSGQYVLCHSNERGWEFVGNVFQPGAYDGIKLRLVKSPEANILYYEEGCLDVTADTAFPYGRLEEFRKTPYLGEANVGLKAQLQFGRRLMADSQRALRKCILRQVEQTNFQSVLYGAATSPSSCGAESPKILSNATLILSYDPYYPNLEICELIQKSLLQIGVEVKLVEDSYERPSVDWDLRFEIKREFASSNYAKIVSLLLNPVTRSCARAAHLCSKLLFESENLKSKEEEIALSTRVNNVIKDFGLEIPLFDVPSLYLSKFPEKKNPLLAVLEVV